MAKTKVPEKRVMKPEPIPDEPPTPAPEPPIDPADQMVLQIGNRLWTVDPSGSFRPTSVDVSGATRVALKAYKV